MRLKDFTHPQLRNGDHQIDQQGDGAGAVDEEFKHLGRRVVVHHHGEERRAGGEEHRHVRRFAAVGPPHEGRRIAAAAQGVEHPRGGIQRRVQTAGDRQEDHAVHNQLGIGNMQQLEHRAVGADALQPRHIPWDEGDDDKDRAQIKNRDTPDHRVGGAHDMFIRGIRFGGGNSDNLRAHKREHGDQHRAQHRAEAVGHKAAVIPQTRNAAHLGIRIKAGNSDRAQYDKRQNSDHFAQRQPELEFAVVFDAQQITAGEGEGDDQREQPHRDARHP